MRRALFLILGLLEFAVAVVLVTFGWQLPGTDDIRHGFGSVEHATARTGDQVHLLRDQVHDLRRPELDETAARLQTQMHKVTGVLRSQTLDFETVSTMSESLGDVADGLNGLASTLDPDSVGKLGDGLGATADFLDQKVAPAAAQAADHLDSSTEALRTDAKALADLLHEAPLDLKAAREIHDGLARFSDGLDKVNGALKLEHFDTMREGVKGLESALTTGAEQVERLSGYTYPVITFNGVKPTVNQKPFWPEGDKIAEGMRKAAQGVNAAGKEMDGLASELPKLRASLDESRKVADRSREALATALQQQDKVEPLLKKVPEQSARLAEDLPKLSADLSRVLRDTEKLKDVAASLRQARKGIDTAVARWPELRTTLTRSASLLKATQQQLRSVTEHRQEYEQAMRESVVLTDEFADRLPQFTHRLDGQLSEQERSFDELGKSIDEVSAALPECEQTTARMVQTTRMLLWLVAAIVGLHGAYLVTAAGLGRRYSV
jgi:ABC-type transporter Mla subunit MlaD